MFPLYTAAGIAGRSIKWAFSSNYRAEVSAARGDKERKRRNWRANIRQTMYEIAQEADEQERTGLLRELSYEVGKLETTGRHRSHKLLREARTFEREEKNRIKTAKHARYLEELFDLLDGVEGDDERSLGHKRSYLNTIQFERDLLARRRIGGQYEDLIREADRVLRREKTALTRAEGAMQRREAASLEVEEDLIGVSYVMNIGREREALVNATEKLRKALRSDTDDHTLLETLVADIGTAQRTFIRKDGQVRKELGMPNPKTDDECMIPVIQANSLCLSVNGQLRLARRGRTERTFGTSDTRSWAQEKRPYATDQVFKGAPIRDLWVRSKETAIKNGATTFPTGEGAPEEPYAFLQWMNGQTRNLLRRLEEGENVDVEQLFLMAAEAREGAKALATDTAYVEDFIARTGTNRNFVAFEVQYASALPNRVTGTVRQLERKKGHRAVQRNTERSPEENRARFTVQSREEEPAMAQT